MKQFQTQHLPGRTVFTENNSSFLYFSGTDYLGMGHHDALRRWLIAGAEQYGTHYGSSRNNRLKLSVYEDAEVLLASFTKAPCALLMSSGIWAGQFVMKEIERMLHNFYGRPAIKYHYAPRVHPALWGNSYIANNHSWEGWSKAVRLAINDSTSQTVHIICTDAIGSPWVEDFDLWSLNNFQTPEHVWLIVDDSHHIGVRGNNGNGSFESLKIRNSANVIVVSSLNKALGIHAGVILSSEKVIGFLRTSPWFAGSSPPAPFFIYALKNLLESGSYTQALDRLKQNISYFNEKFSRQNLFTNIADYPVFCSESEPLYTYLLKNGIMASCFSYPSADDVPVTRLAINALHQKEDLDRLAEVCMKFSDQFNS